VEIQRHNAVTAVLCQLCTQTKQPVKMEEFRRAQERNRRPDLTVTLPPERADDEDVAAAAAAAAREAAGDARPTVRHYVDVAVGNVLAPTYEAAALMGTMPTLLERRKELDYAAWLRDNPGVLVPFGCSSVGQLGPSALRLLSMIKGFCKRAGRPISLRWWMARLSVIFVRFGVRIADEWRARCSEVINGRHEGAAASSATEEDDALLTTV